MKHLQTFESFVDTINESSNPSIDDLGSYGNVYPAKDFDIMGLQPMKLDPKGQVVMESPYDEWDAEEIEKILTALEKNRKVKEWKSVTIDDQGGDVEAFYFVPAK